MLCHTRKHTYVIHTTVQYCKTQVHVLHTNKYKHTEYCQTQMYAQHTNRNTQILPLIMTACRNKVTID